MDDELFLGKIIRGDAKWARLEPLAVRRGGRWADIEDKVQMFPTEGKVFSKRGLPNAFMDSLWTFKRRINDRPDNGADLLLAEDVVKATPILDLSVLSIEQARQRLFNQGVEIPFDGESASVAVLLADGLFCGLSISRSADGLWRALPVPGYITLREVPDEWTSPRTFDGLTILPAQAIPSAYAVRRVNWCGDHDFIERVLERFRKFTQHVSDTPYARPSKEGVKYIARALQQAELLPGDDDDVELNLERLESQWPILEARFLASERLSELVLGSAAAKNAISEATAEATAQAIDAARPEVERQVKHDFEVSFAEKVTHRDELSQEIEALTYRRDSLAQELQGIEELCHNGRKEQDILSNELRTVVNDVRTALAVTSPQEQLFAKVVAERIERVLRERGHRGPSLIPSSVAPWSLPLAVVNVREVNLDQLVIRISEEAQLHAVNEFDLQMLDAFARAGELVLIQGPQAELAVRAYARCVAGGTFRSMALDPSVIGLDDLWRSPGTQLPTAMAHAWHAAESEPDTLHILCLRNLDSAPFRLWFSSLHSVLSFDSRPRNLLLLATAMSVDADSVSSRVENSGGGLHRWLVPISPGVHADGIASVLGSIVPPIAPASRLRVAGSITQDSSRFAGWGMRVSSIATSPDTLARMARLGDSLVDANDEEIQLALFKWCQFISSADDKELPNALRDGYAALGTLKYQH
ncbi:hypothetical protein [Paraburkholderia aspalathi]|uniref:hypothetical protein n=1 Tax=Paraburkholderia aspalathi TaxID=1324617 RepID=UPI0038BB24C7